MRILFCSLGTYGHTYPLLPLAIAARDAGHEITFATDMRFKPLLEKLGFRHEQSSVPVEGAYAEGLKVCFGKESPEGLDSAQLREVAAVVFGTLIPRRSADQLAPVIAHAKPDLVVHDVSSYGAEIAGALAGVPVVCHGVGRESPDDFTLTIEGNVWALAAELGVELPEGRLLGSGNPYLDIYPDSMQDKEFLETGRRLPLRPVQFAEDGELPEWVCTRDRDRPLVYLTLGTSGSGTPQALCEAIDGLAALDVDVLVSTCSALDIGELGEIPPRVRLEAWVPQATLLPELDLVAHHGGSGTTLGALAAGVPQLCIPWENDPFGSADAVLAVGAGLRLLPGELTAAAVRTSAEQLLTDPGYRSATGKVAAEIARMPAPETVAADLPRLTASYPDIG